jgi:hypothetical protein
MSKLGYQCTGPHAPNPHYLKVKEILENRIAQLYEADAKFCQDRWDQTKPECVRAMAREHSNQVTFARQELQNILKAITP